MSSSAAVSQHCMAASCSSSTGSRARRYRLGDRIAGGVAAGGDQKAEEVHQQHSFRDRHCRARAGRLAADFRLPNTLSEVIEVCAGLRNA